MLGVRFFQKKEVKMVKKIAKIPFSDKGFARNIKIFVALASDVSLCIFAVWLAFYLRLGEFIKISMNELTVVATSIFIMIPVFYTFGLYRFIFRYAGLKDFIKIAQAIFIYGIIYAAIFTAFGVDGIPRTVGIIQPILLMLLVTSSRVAATFYSEFEYQTLLKKAPKQNVLIYGAGSAGRQLAAAISADKESYLVGFIDDNQELHGHVLNGQPIYNPVDLPVLVNELEIKDILLAMPSVPRKRRNEILSQIREVQVSVRTLPSVSDLVQGKVTVSDLRELDIDDLLGRESVAPNKSLLAENITGKIVMVTGAGGSIGSELCRQILSLDPKKLLFVEQSEFALYNIHQELEIKKTDMQLIPLLASVQDAHRMNEIMSTWHPHTVYHAAAYKHVPLVEHNLAEGLKNNVLGTLVTAQVAITHGVRNFVLISTDKAVRPTNIMGASKRLAEMILQALAEKNPSVKLSMVRFGNVLGSSGSVVPKFRQQIRAGGPVTITHPNITRFFMTVSEASQLVIQAGAMATGGDVFVLDMGKPIKIMDLAKRMIELSGLSLKNEQNPVGDIEIEITKLRPGEKLYEELLIGNNPESTSHPRIMKAHEAFVHWKQLEDQINIMTDALHANDVDVIRRLVDELVPDYQPNHEIVDWVYVEQELGNITSK
jgi:FlaA1/EpsC-like NDP-sugar epimerase